MSIEQNAMACNRFYQLVRDFSAKRKSWEPAIRYFTQPDEKYDITLISQRVYFRREEFLTVMAAAGLSSVSEPLSPRLLVLPTEGQLRQLKQMAGYENNHEKRQFRQGG